MTLKPGTKIAADLPMKIVRVVTRMNIGGPARHVAILTNELDPAQFRTCLVMGTADPGEGELSGLVEGRHARVIRLPGLRRSLRPWQDLLTLVRLLKIVWRERPQVLHTHMAKAGVLGRVAAWAYNHLGPGRAPGRRVTVLHTFHGHVLEGYFSPASNRFFIGVERRLARISDRLIAVSPAVRHELLALGIGREAQWRVVPLGLHLEAFAALALPVPGETVRFGLVGRLVPIKDPELFVEGLRRAWAQRPSASEGVVVGDGPLRGAVEAQIAAQGLADVVRCIGWQHELPAVYAGLDVVCVTSRNEGTPVALIEAMAAGRAVIGTAVGGVPDLLEDAPGPIPSGGVRVTGRGVLVNAGDADGVAGAMLLLASDPALRERLGRAARAHVLERYSHERLVRDLAGLYRELLGDDGSAPRCMV